jgi:hypothetical protein
MKDELVFLFKYLKIKTLGVMNFFQSINGVRKVILPKSLLTPHSSLISHLSSLITLLSFCIISCGRSEIRPVDAAVCSPNIENDATSLDNTTVRGALLGTRFSSLEDLKKVIRIEYENGVDPTDSTAPVSRVVRVYHCSSGREVVSILETGTSQGDFIKARYDGAFMDKLAVLTGSPYAVMNRRDLDKIYALLRFRPEWFGLSDVSFFDMARTMVTHINTPDLAFKNPRDSTEKGYLNTFNHMTAQAFITSCFSEDLADFIADVHERYRQPELISGKFTAAQLADLNEGPVDNYVDIINNEWGQELGKHLQQKYGINQNTHWTPQLLAAYLNDLQAYFSWAFQIGFAPFTPNDPKVVRFAGKLNTVMKGRLTFNQ